MSQREGTLERAGSTDSVDPSAEGEGGQQARERGLASTERWGPLVIGREGAGARAGWAWWAKRPSEGGSWAALAFFLFLLNFYSLFFLFFLLNSNPTKPQIQILNISNMCINHKQSLSST
jgi:hypothetical protein